MPLTKSPEIVDNAIQQLESVSGKIRILANSKLQNILEKNLGLNTVTSIRDILLKKTQKTIY